MKKKSIGSSFDEFLKEQGELVRAKKLRAAINEALRDVRVKRFKSKI